MTTARKDLEELASDVSVRPPGHPDVTIAQAKQRAAYAVRAVNNFEALVEALKEFVRLDDESELQAADGSELVMALNDARAALAADESSPGKKRQTMMVCIWTEIDPDDMTGVFETTCGHTFSLNSDSPEENQMKFCCYCGDELTSVKATAALLANHDAPEGRG